jgi:hypothetical protein
MTVGSCLRVASGGTVVLVLARGASSGRPLETFLETHAVAPWARKKAQQASVNNTSAVPNRSFVALTMFTRA